METTIVQGWIGIILGFVLGLYSNNGKYSGNYFSVGLSRSSSRGYIGVMKG